MKVIVIQSYITNKTARNTEPELVLTTNVMPLPS